MQQVYTVWVLLYAQKNSYLLRKLNIMLPNNIKPTTKFTFIFLLRIVSFIHLKNFSARLINIKNVQLSDSLWLHEIFIRYILYTEQNIWYVTLLFN